MTKCCGISLRKPAAARFSHSRWRTWSSRLKIFGNELTHQYTLSYRPEPLITDGLFHTIEMRVKGRKDLIVRTRKGYYARKM